MHNRSVRTWTTIYMTIGGIECGCPCEAKQFASTFKVMEDQSELLGREQDSVLKCECLPMCASWQGPNLLSVSPAPPSWRQIHCLVKKVHTESDCSLALYLLILLLSILSPSLIAPAPLSTSQMLWQINK